MVSEVNVTYLNHLGQRKRAKLIKVQKGVALVQTNRHYIFCDVRTIRKEQTK